MRRNEARATTAAQVNVHQGFGHLRPIYRGIPKLHQELRRSLIGRSHELRG